MVTTQQPPQVRLPGGGSSNRGSEVGLGLLALVGTLLIVFGVPVLLLATIGSPLPTSMPTMEWATRSVTVETVLKVLAVVVWLAWLHFVVCLVVELASTRKRGVAPRVPGGGVGTQSLARRLVATIALLATSSGVMVSTAAAASAATHSPSSQASFTRHVNQVSKAAVHDAGAKTGGTVRGALPDNEDLERATRHDVRSGTQTYYEVHPPHGRRYDTMWDIADRYLGDGRRYKELWAANKGRVQPDGRRLENANLIYPGWVLRMPDDAKGPGLKVVNHAHGGGDVAQGSESRAASGAGAADVVAAPHADVAVQERASAWTPVFGVAGGLVVAGAALGLRRRRQGASFAHMWERVTARTSGPAPDPTDPNPPGGGGGATAEVLHEAEPSTAAWLSQGLRAWGPHPAPSPTSVSAGKAGVVVGFAEHPGRDVPTGWSEYDESTWTLGRDVSLAAQGVAPLPGLVSVGQRGDGTIAMVDLESAGGVVSLDGDPEVARGLALSMAVDTATHPWADRRDVTLVGFADDLSGVARGVLRHSSSLARTLEALDGTARYQRELCRRSGATTARESRGQTDGVGWSYHLVVCSGVPSDGELAHLRALAADPQVSIAVVVVGSVREAAVRLGAQPDGRLVSPVHGIDVVAQVLTTASARRLAASFAMPETQRGGSVSLDEMVETLQVERESASSAVAHLDVLGPVSLEAPGEVDPDRVAFLTEMAAFIALHPQGVHVHRVTGALWPRGVADEQRDTALHQLADWLGETPDGQRVLQVDAGVCRMLPGALAMDWDQFRLRLNQAVDRGQQRENLLRGALNLVRGPAFEEIPEGRYSWLEQLGTLDDIALAIGLTAQALAQAADQRGDQAAAAEALERGLQLLPANEDLWRASLVLASQQGGRGQVAVVAGRMYDAIAKHGSPMGAEPQTDALVDELAPGWRTRVA